MSKKSVAVQIAGHAYRIRSDSDEENLRRIASYVDQAMQRVRDGTGTVDSLDVAVLTCLNLAREILALRERHDDSFGADGDRLRGLIERVESALGPTKSAAAQASSPAPEPETVSEGAEGSDAPVRTLDWPGVEALRERGEAPEAPSAEAGQGGVPEARVAAGGRRDRAS